MAADNNNPENDSRNLELMKLYQRRREKLPEEARRTLSSRPWGLALSGGGIRSATFCFGLITALAKNRLLHRFDLMSTVSGGGYIGSAIGKLFHNAGEIGKPDPLKLEHDLGEVQAHWFDIWLRANGRYLIPRGLKDILFALANFGRNLFGVHVELALLSLILGSVLVALDLAVWQWADCSVGPEGCGRWPSVDSALIGFFADFPTLWIVLVPVAWIGSILSCAYWALPTRNGQSLGIQRALTAILAGAGIVLLLRDSVRWLNDWLPSWLVAPAFPGALVALAIGLLSAWVVGILLAKCLGNKAKNDFDGTRNALTKALAITLSVALGIVLLGWVDYLAWALANFNTTSQSQLAAVLVLLAVALRATVPMIADLPKSLVPGTRRVVLGGINVLGILLAAALLVFWVSLLHRATASVLFNPLSAPPKLDFGLAWQYLLWLATPVVLMVLVSATNRDFLNRSSLYAFYRARLIRAYLGAANPKRFESAASSPQSSFSLAKGHELSSRVTQVAEGDDLSMSAYRPHEGGGPVHLINVCVNQTHDPMGGLFNQDRKGSLLTVGPGGYLLHGGAGWQPGDGTQSLSLGAWMAISGAAVAPGLGKSTRSGIAALLMMSGIRLGYWWDSQGMGRQSPAGRVGKYRQLLSELFGRFVGDQRQDWFLSDGGHFENTAAYALLREQCELIVVADCGADPRYAFGDLENLVRKARIDLQAEITFLRPIRPDRDLPVVFGSLNELASPDSEACLALARVDYLATQLTGYLIIVKPNMSNGAPVDLVNFKSDNPLFPQEPTTDQAFSEAQWESYFQLGKALGQYLELEQLEDLGDFARTYFVNDDGAILVKESDGARVLKFSSKRLSSRIASTGAVSASISLGAITSIGLAGWQAVSNELTHRGDAEQIEPAILKELTTVFGRMSMPGKPVSPTSVDPLGEMASALLWVGHQGCTAYNVEAYRSSLLMNMMLNRTREACLSSASAHPSCTELLDETTLPNCLRKTLSARCEAQYWIRDYSVTSLNTGNCGWAVDSRIKAKTVAQSTGKNSWSRAQVKTESVKTQSAESESEKPLEKTCAGKTIYLQIYGPELRDFARTFRESWRALGASVPPIEDVLDNARRANRRAPKPHPVPTVIYYDTLSAMCVGSLFLTDETQLWNSFLRPGSNNGQPGVIEVWLPPSTKVPPDQKL